jgi:hypothetical protein
MTLLANYLMRAILTSTLLVMLVLLALAGLFEFIGQLETTQGSFGIPEALLFAVLRLPQLSFEMFPIASLIGALLGLGALANNSELVVMRTAGLSVGNLAGMVSLSGLVLMVTMGLIGEYIGPPLDYFARTMRLTLARSTCFGSTMTILLRPSQGPRIPVSMIRISGFSKMSKRRDFRMIRYRSSSPPLPWNHLNSTLTCSALRSSNQSASRPGV